MRFILVLFFLTFLTLSVGCATLTSIGIAKGAYCIIKLVKTVNDTVKYVKECSKESHVPKVQGVE